MKIAFLTTTFETTSNGPAKFARLVYQFSQEWHNELFIVTEDTLEAGENVIKISVPTFLNYPGIGFLYRIFMYFVKVVTRKGIEVVVTNNAMYGFLFNLLTRKKVIGFINDYQHISPVFKLNYASIRSFIFARFERFALKHNQITIVNSRYLHNCLTSAYGVESEKLFILPKGIEIDDKAQANLEKHEDDKVFRVLFVKTNFKVGGLEYLLKAFAGLEGVHLDIVTSSKLKESNIYDYVKDCVSVSIYHYLPQEEVFDLMKQAHCLCIPSEKEALGVANIEGMYHSCVILATEVGGIPEVLDYGRSGVLVPFGDETELRKNILLLKKDRVMRINLVKNGFQSAKKFSISNSIKSFFELLDGQ